MTAQQSYILIAIVALAITAAGFFLIGKKPQKLSPLAGLAFGCVLAGLFMSGNRILGYSLIAFGILLSVIDAIIKAHRVGPRPLVDRGTSHSTVRTVRYTALPKFTVYLAR